MRINSVLLLLLAFLANFFVPATRADSDSFNEAAYPVDGLHFVPDSQEFWDFSKNWTTNYGPAYRDTLLELSGLVPCWGDYALCFHSGPEPLPCEQTPDGRFANCKCTVDRGLNFVLITSILNYEVYKRTIDVCGSDGSGCTTHPNKAPVCGAIARGRLIPGADVISTYSPGHRSTLASLRSPGPTRPPLTICPKGPYAGCMTAPCKKTADGKAECSCPVFWGVFQLAKSKARCTLPLDRVWSASYDPTLDTLPY